ncbi:MAG: alkylphosphonate utilization protein [Saprospiraceae bacterium]
MDDIVVKDSNGNVLSEGDSVQLTRDLKVKGTSTNLKRGTVFKNIRLTGNDKEIECRVGKGQMVLKTMYLKKK